MCDVGSRYLGTGRPEYLETGPIHKCQIQKIGITRSVPLIFSIISRKKKPAYRRQARKTEERKMKVVKGFVVLTPRLVRRDTKVRLSKKNYNRRSNRRVERAAKEG